jgi:DNA repair photolyase
MKHGSGKADTSAQKLKQVQKELAQAKKQHLVIQQQTLKQMAQAIAAAYDHGFNDALDELEHFTAERDRFLSAAEGKFEKTYARSLVKSAKAKRNHAMEHAAETGKVVSLKKARGKSKAKASKIAK